MNQQTARIRVSELADKFIQQNDPTGWFEALYSQAKGDISQIPWANSTVNPNLSEWLTKNHIQGLGKKALVVGCGLGDDAEALAAKGFVVTGFDISPSAISWCKQRFPDSKVNYVVSNALELESSWKENFDLILESYTLQAVPSLVRNRIIKTIVEYVALQGTILIICRGRDKLEDEGKHPPYRLTQEELSLIEELGLKKVTLEDYLDGETPPVRRFRILYRKG